MEKIIKQLEIQLRVTQHNQTLLNKWRNKEITDQEFMDGVMGEGDWLLEEKNSMEFHVHEDLEEASEFYKIPYYIWTDAEVYILQEDRCVFVGSRFLARRFIERNEGRVLKGKYSIKRK